MVFTDDPWDAVEEKWLMSQQEGEHQCPRSPNEVILIVSVYLQMSWWWRMLHVGVAGVNLQSNITCRGFMTPLNDGLFLK